MKKKFNVLLLSATALISINATSIQPLLGQENLGVEYWTGFYAGVFGGLAKGRYIGTAAAVGDNSSINTSTVVTGTTGTTVVTSTITTTTTFTTICTSEALTAICTFTFSGVQTITETITTTATLTDVPEAFVYDVEDFSIGDESWTLGVRAGADMSHGPFVLGIVGDLAVTDLNAIYDFTGPSGATLELGQDFIGTLRARVGVAAANWLFYGTAGVAGSQVNAALTSDFGGSPSTYHGSAFMFGWAAGIGASAALAPNIFLDLTYLHLDLGTTSFSFNGMGGQIGSADVGVSNDIFTIGIMFKT